MEPNVFLKSQISYDSEDSFQPYRNFLMVMEGMTKFYEDLHSMKESSAEAKEMQVF